MVTCNRSPINTTGFIYRVYKVKWDKRTEMLVPLGAPAIIPIDAGKPRSYLGDGKIVLKKKRYQPVTDEERIVLEVIKGGADNYETLVDYIETNGDMTEDEILGTLKELTFRKSKRAIDYPCYFRLFNSKSATVVKTALKLQEE